MKARSFIYFIVVLALFSSISFAQRTYTGDPVTKNGLLKALKLRQFQTADIVKIVNEQGVDFKLAGDIENELRANGARPELIEAVRRNYRGALKIKPTNTSNTYESLVSQAINIYESANSANRAIEILNQAVALEPGKYRAYQMLGYVTLYGKRDFKKAEEYMRKAMDLGGSAVFRLKHAHDYNFFKSCEGSFYISRNTIRFEGDDNQDTFNVRDTEIVKIDTQGKWSGVFTLKMKGGIFHIVIREKGGNENDKYQFSPLTGKDEERKMIIRLIGK
ncbi:MAG TPA: hypothetical protein PKY82_22960 [Pyrinomonadaceae bacterium]|nr:hypothetical protein [Pyrinomonadaceae bacterium]